MMMTMMMQMFMVEPRICTKTLFDLNILRHIDLYEYLRHIRAASEEKQEFI